jgi:hypothetical protein
MKNIISIALFVSIIFGTCSVQKKNNRGQSDDTTNSKDSAGNKNGTAIFGAGDFVLGIDFYSNKNPVGAGDTMSALFDAVARNLPKAVDAANQHILNFGGNIGINRSNPGYKTCDPNCDDLWSKLDWSWVDARVKLMQAMHIPIKMITFYGAPNFMTQIGDKPNTSNQKPGWNHYSDGARVDPQYNQMWADLCHYIVKRYLPRGITYYQVWNEMKGYYAEPIPHTADGVTYRGWDFPGYTKMYNAVWDRIKDDPATAKANIGGPYAIMVLHQADGTTPGAKGRTWGGHVVLKGKWGGIRPEVTGGLKYWKKYAHGWDFLCVDGDPADAAGDHGGSYNPNNWSSDYVRSYWHDVGKWLHDHIAEGKPIVWSEVYPRNSIGNDKDWKKSLNMMRDPKSFGLSPCKNAATGDSEPCINLTLVWGDNDPSDGFYSLTNDHGQLTPVGKMYQAYKKAHPFNPE